MTVIQDQLKDVAGEPFEGTVTFRIERIREGADGTSIVTIERHHFQVDGGSLLTTDMDPGRATVRFSGDKNTYPIVISDSATPIRLWPLIDAGQPAPPATASGFLRVANGDEARIDFVTSTEYATLTPDPNTVYLVFQD